MHDIVWFRTTYQDGSQGRYVKWCTVHMTGRIYYDNCLEECEIVGDTKLAYLLISWIREGCVISKDGSN